MWQSHTRSRIACCNASKNESCHESSCRTTDDPEPHLRRDPGGRLRPARPHAAPRGHPPVRRHVGRRQPDPRRSRIRTLQPVPRGRRPQHVGQHADLHRARHRVPRPRHGVRVAGAELLAPDHDRRHADDHGHLQGKVRAQPPHHLRLPGGEPGRPQGDRRHRRGDGADREDLARARRAARGHRVRPRAALPPPAVGVGRPVADPDRGGPPLRPRIPARPGPGGTRRPGRADPGRPRVAHPRRGRRTRDRHQGPAHRRHRTQPRLGRGGRRPVPRRRRRGADEGLAAHRRDDEPGDQAPAHRPPHQPRLPRRRADLPAPADDHRRGDHDRAHARG
ncbi:MAG: hypothetical protein BWZ09_02474 [Alphaproteobacteria bacterium ADurb.BinA305]|nr:MAG: hypothetical protein BWZ09_02474 [Alphaproteobacteria bacterium ADurb.BinA305]